MPGTYYLTLTDSLGCTTTDSVHVDIYNSGCSDTAATNFDPLADVFCNSGCTYCYATADFVTDSIQACDSTLISIAPSITSSYVWDTPSDFMVVFLLIIIAVTATLGNFFWTKAISMTTLTNLMPFDFSKLIFATFLGVIFFNEKIDLITIFCGSGIVICNSLIAKKISNEKE